MKELSKRMYGAEGRDDRTEQAVPGRTTQVERVQRKADGNGVHADAARALARADSSSGAPLPAAIQRKFEGSLGADLSPVRVHTGGDSAAAADAVSARAYTVGNHIHFNAGQYDPDSAAGQHLLAHEVAHTVQQSGGASRPQLKPEVSQPGDAHEHEADCAADAMVQGRAFSVGSAAGISRKRDQPDPVMDAVSYFSKPAKIQPTDWTEVDGRRAPMTWDAGPGPSYKPQPANFYVDAGMKELGKTWLETFNTFLSVQVPITEYRRQALVAGGLSGAEQMNEISGKSVGAAFAPGIEQEIKKYDPQKLKSLKDKEELVGAKLEMRNALSTVQQARSGVLNAGTAIEKAVKVSEIAVAASQIPPLQARDNEYQVRILQLQMEKERVAGAISSLSKALAGLAAFPNPGQMAAGVIDGLGTAITTDSNHSYNQDILAVTKQIDVIRGTIFNINQLMANRTAEIADRDLVIAKRALDIANQEYNKARVSYQKVCNAYSVKVAELAGKMGMAAPEAAQLQNAVESIPKIQQLRSECDDLANRCTPPRYSELPGYGLTLAENGSGFIVEVSKLKGAQQELRHDSEQWTRRLSSIKPLL